MRASDIFRLVLLAAIWGGSLVFLRVLIAWGTLTIYGTSTLTSIGGDSGGSI